MSTRANRLEWLDVSKGLAILYIAFFHLFNTWTGDAVPPTTSPLVSAWYTVVGLGFHAVGAFLIISGWSLTQSCAKQERHGPIAWWPWYRKKLFRLYPLYWVAHLVFIGLYLASRWTGWPLVDTFEPLTARQLVISLLGVRFIDIQSNFYYLNAAWWYVTALLQLYLVFPLLYMTLRRIGAVPMFVLASAIGLALRYLSLVVSPSHESLWWFSDGLWVQGGLGLCRLPEFALGMLLGEWYLHDAQRAERLLLNGPALIVGLAAYPFALRLYQSLLGYVFVDLATGACFLLVLVGVAGLVARLGRPAAVIGVCGTYSYGIYLLHQPHVISVGLRTRELSALAFAGVAIATLAAVAVEGIVVEKSVNRLMGGRGAPKARQAA